MPASTRNTPTKIVITPHFFVPQHLQQAMAHKKVCNLSTSSYVLPAQMFALVWIPAFVLWFKFTDLTPFDKIWILWLLMIRLTCHLQNLDKLQWMGVLYIQMGVVIYIWINLNKLQSDNVQPSDFDDQWLVDDIIYLIISKDNILV